LNQVRLRATLLGREVTRFTPAGLPVVEAVFLFEEQVAEAGQLRALRFEFDALALGEAARRLERDSLGIVVDLAGFIAPRSRRSRRLRVHITDYTRVSGD
jgi:primosomal replication protein N